MSANVFGLRHLAQEDMDTNNQNASVLFFRSIIDAILYLDFNTTLKERIMTTCSNLMFYHSNSYSLTDSSS